MLDSGPRLADDPILPPLSVATLLSQTAFQVSVMVALVFYGAGWIEGGVEFGGVEHWTFVFNAFVMLQLFNQMNCQIGNEPDKVRRGDGPSSTVQHSGRGTGPWGGGPDTTFIFSLAKAAQIQPSSFLHKDQRLFTQIPYLASKRRRYAHRSPSRHYTIGVPLDSLSRSSLQVNAVERLSSNPLFLGVLSLEALLQVFIVQFGGPVFNTVPLSQGAWCASVAIGATSLLVHRIATHAVRGIRPPKWLSLG